MSLALPTRRREIDSLSDAYEVLMQHNHAVGRIISFDSDSILFLATQTRNAPPRPRTAWIFRNGEGEIEKVGVVVGFTVAAPEEPKIC